jgi:hypothetical protein
MVALSGTLLVVFKSVRQSMTFFFSPEVTLSLFQAVCAFTTSTFEKMKSLSAGGPGWQVLRVSGRQAGGGFFTLAGQNMDEWGWAWC